MAESNAEAIFVSAPHMTGAVYPYLFGVISLTKNVVISNEPWGNCAPEVRRNLVKADIRLYKAYKIFRFAQEIVSLSHPAHAISSLHRNDIFF
ncbi:hypothetical protein FHS10_005679 [Mucilaginibacter dorajii]|nr:hypothetical protein [Mucilaginibacter dorajii]